MIYVAQPYTHPQKAVMRWRYEQGLRYTSMLICQGRAAFSPIVHSHPVAEMADLPRDVSFWRDFNRQFMEIVDSMHYLKLPGWEESVGLAEELQWAKELGIETQGIVTASLKLVGAAPK